MSTRAWPVCWLFWIAVAAWPPAGGIGAEPAGTADAPLEIRRIYAPADRLKDWPFGPTRYVPVDSADFERLWEAARMTGAAMPGLPDAHVAAARYQARFGDGPSLSGEAVLEVVEQGSAPVMVPLDPCGLTMGAARWFDRKEETREAVVGLRPEGKLAVLAEHSGELHFPWSLRGKGGSAGAVDFLFQFPRCIANRLVLDLPGELRPIVDHGIANDTGGSTEGYHRWQIDCGGYSHVGLHLAAATTADQAPHPILLRQSVVYDFSLRGVDVATQVQLDVPERPLHQLVLVLDPGLQLVAARIGNRTVPWSVAAAVPGGASRVVLEMPEPIQGTGQSLRLTALAPLCTDKLWRLPKIRVEDAFWQQGSATLLTPFPLLIEQINLQGCRQSGTGPLAGSRLGESLQLEYFSPDAAVDVTLRRGLPRLQLTSGILLDWGDAEIKAQMTADFRTADGESFVLEGDVSKDWIVDSVESTPSDAMDAWSLDDSGVPAKLKITLAKAILPNRPVRIRVAARRLYSHLGPKRHLGQKLGVEDLLPLHFVARGGSEQLVAIDVPGNCHLNITAAELLHRLDPGSLNARQLGLFPAPPRQMVFRENPAEGRVLISLESRLPAYAATIRTEATLARDTFQESYALRCVPESAPVDRVMVHFSRQRSVPLRWEMKNAPAGEITARALTAAEQFVSGVSPQEPQEEAWEILLRRPRNEPFELRGLRSFKFSNPEPVSLASLPEAAAQSGTLIIRSGEAEAYEGRGGPSRALKINTRLTPIDVDPPPAGAWAAYRYNPARDAVASWEGPVTVLRTDEMVTQPLWIWSCRLQSRYQTDGSAEHLAVYRLQNVTRNQLRLTLPRGVTTDSVRNVWIDQSPIVWQRVACGDRNVLSLDLPLGEKFPTLAVSFTTSEPRMGLLGSREPPLPQCNGLPALARIWTIWLPPGYDCVDLATESPAATLLPSLSQRLFGPLGRAAAAANPGNPLAADTWALAISDQAARELLRHKAETWLSAMGQLVAATSAGDKSGSLTWHALLADRSLRQLGFTPLVDRYALAELGITPATPVRPEQGETPWACGVSLLAHSNLALLLSAESVCLTSQTQAAAAQAWLVPLGHGPLWWVPPGPLADQLKDTALVSGAASLLPIEAWKEQLSEPLLPWKEVRPGGDEAFDTYGWHAYRLPLPDPPPRFRFVQAKTMLLWSWSIFLLIAGLGWWKAGERPAVVVFLLVVAAIVAIFVPLAYVPIASCTVLGLLFCLVVRLVFPRRPAIVREPPRDRTFELPAKVMGPAGIALATMIALGWQSGSALGQSAASQPLAAKPVKPAAVYDVFIPSDDHQQPTGGKYYVPEGLYRQLCDHADEASNQPHGWLVNQAVYRGVLAWQASPERLVLSEMKAIFDLRVFSQVMRVRIPLRQEITNLAIEQVLLDGREVQPQWDPDTGNPVILVSEPGPYRLELVLRPVLHALGVQTGLDFAIPPLANSRLELTVPMGAPAIDIPSALGSIRREEETSRIFAALGPANRLTVSWQQGARRSSAGTTVDVEELVWLRIRPGSVVLDAKFKFRVLGGHLRELQLAADPRLRLLPLKQTDLPIAEVRTVAGEPQVIRFELARPVADQAVLEAGFLLTGTSGVGNLRLPELEALGARLAKRSVAVTIDPSLAYEEHVPDPTETMLASDFLGDWGTKENPPQFAFRPATEQSSWSLSTRPRKPHTLVDQVLAVSFTHGSAEVHYDAQLTTTAGYCFQYRLLAPDGLEIESAALRAGGVDRAARWSQDHGCVTVFLNGPVSGKQTLALRGRLPLPPRKPIPLPLVRFDQEGQGQTCMIQSFLIQIYRRPSVRLDVDRLHGLSQLDSGAIEPTKRDLGRLVKTFTADGKEPIRAMVSLKPNQPKVRSEQTIRLRANGPVWEVQTDFRLDVQDGLLDQIKITAPSPWDGPYQITPPEAHQIVAPPGDLRQLLVEPKSAVSGKYQLSITAPVSFAPGEPISVPDIRLPNTVVQKRLLLLPTQHEGQPIAWKEKGLKPTELPADFRPLPAPGSVVAYQIWGEPFHATLHQLPQTETVEIRLADICLAWNADDSCRGVAVFDFRPGRSPYLPISLPSGYQLIHVSVGGVSVAPEPAGTNAWRVPLSYGLLPQPVEVLFTGKGRDIRPGGRMRFDAPSPGRLPVIQTLWSVAGPLAAESGGLGGSALLTPLARTGVRAKSLIELFDLGTAATTGEAEDLLRWYRLWSHRLTDARAAVERELAYARLAAVDDRETTAALEADLEALQQRQSQAAGWLAAAGPASAPPRDEAGPVELWFGTAERPQSLQQQVFSGWVDSITLSPAIPASTTLREQLGLAVVLAGIGGLALLALRYAGLCCWFRRRPHLLAMIAGLAWWIWLSPAIVGPVVVAASLAAWLIQRRKSSPREAVILSAPPS